MVYYNGPAGAVVACVSGRNFELFSIITNDFIEEIVLLCCTHAHTVYTRARAVDAEDDKSLGDLKGENRKYFEKFYNKKNRCRDVAFKYELCEFSPYASS